jgi:hypothetical protein
LTFRFAIVLGVIINGLGVHAQQPFVTDDADVTEKGKFHVEVANEFDKLQRSALPENYQNGTRFNLSYGLVKNLEVGLDAEIIGLVSNQRPKAIAGIGDTTFGAKYNFLHEHEESRLPAMAIGAYIEFPTGDPMRSLGSGVRSYGINGIVQKTVGKRNIFRANAGYLFAGNTVVGALGLSAVRGHVFTGNLSYVRKMHDRLSLVRKSRPQFRAVFG